MKTTKNFFLYLITLQLIILLSGCSLSSTIAKAPIVTITFRPSATFTLQPTPIPTLTSTNTQVATNTPIPSITPSHTPQNVKITASVAVETLNVREGPGTVFPISFKLTENEELTITQKTPGDEWVKIDYENTSVGWVSAIFLEYTGDLSLVETAAVESAHIIQGQITDIEGNPIDAINIAVYQGSGSSQLRTDARTNVSGVFQAFLPLDVDPRWMISVVGIGCTSRIVDSDCEYSGKFEPVTYTVDLPINQDIIHFTYISP